MNYRPVTATVAKAAHFMSASGIEAASRCPARRRRHQALINHFADQAAAIDMPLWLTMPKAFVSLMNF